MLILFLLVFGLTSYTTITPLSDNDFLGGPDIVVPAETALTGLNKSLVNPLPASTEVLGFIEGGFQDRFWQFKLRLPDADIPEALAALDAEGVFPFQTDIFGLPDNDWWDPGAQTGQQVGNGDIPGFTATQILTAPDLATPGYTLIYVFAFQT